MSVLFKTRNFNGFSATISSATFKVSDSLSRQTLEAVIVFFSASTFCKTFSSSLKGEEATNAMLQFPRDRERDLTTVAQPVGCEIKKLLHQGVNSKLKNKLYKSKMHTGLV